MSASSSSTQPKIYTVDELKNISITKENDDLNQSLKYLISDLSKRDPNKKNIILTNIGKINVKTKLYDYPYTEIDPVRNLQFQKYLEFKNKEQKLYLYAYVASAYFKGQREEYINYLLEGIQTAETLYQKDKKDDGMMKIFRDIALIATLKLSDFKLVLEKFKNRQTTQNFDDELLSTASVSSSPIPSLPPSPRNSPQPGTSQLAQNMQNIMPQQPSPGQQQASNQTQSTSQTQQSLSNPSPIQMSTQASSQSASSVSTITPFGKTEIENLRQSLRRPEEVLDPATGIPVSTTFNIESDIKNFNDYVLAQVATNQSIDYNFVQQVRRKYPFIMTDEYERNILGYNGIINTGIVSNIPVNFKDLVLPIPSYIQNIPDQKDKQVQLNLKQAIDRGYQIVSSKDGFKNDYITFKQKEGQNKFVGSYIHPKLKGKFRVRYEGKNNTFVISNPNYPTGYVKTGFQIYSYLNSLLKKQEKESQKPFVYMPRIAVAYQ